MLLGWKACRSSLGSHPPTQLGFGCSVTLSLEQPQAGQVPKTMLTKMDYSPQLKDSSRVKGSVIKPKDRAGAQ